MNKNKYLIYECPTRVLNPLYMDQHKAHQPPYTWIIIKCCLIVVFGSPCNDSPCGKQGLADTDAHAPSAMLMPYVLPES